jgi:hypothetical protein
VVRTTVSCRSASRLKLTELQCAVASRGLKFRARAMARWLFNETDAEDFIEA